VTEPAKPRGPGRPKASEPGSRVTTWLSETEHDQMVSRAKVAGTSVSALVRIALKQHLKDR
jgi:hypothetical protein